MCQQQLGTTGKVAEKTFRVACLTLPTRPGEDADGLLKDNDESFGGTKIKRRYVDQDLPFPPAASAQLLQDAI